MLSQWQPKKTKFKRLQKGTIRKCEYRASALRMQQGSYGLRVLRSGRLTAKQLEQARRKISKIRKRKEKQFIWFRCIPDIQITAKPQGIRMGKGKGAVKYWISKLTAGKLIFHINWIQKRRALRVLKNAAQMLPVPTKIWTNKVLGKKKINIVS